MELPESLRSALLAVKPDFEAVDLSDLADLLGAIHLIDPRIASSWGRHRCAIVYWSASHAKFPGQGRL